MIKTINTQKAPKAIGPYSQAVKTKYAIYISGQLPVDPKTNEVVSENVAEQTRQVMKNIEAVLETENLTLTNIAKTTIYLKDLSQFDIVNEEYSNALNGHKPARATIEVSRLPKDVLVEIEAVVDTE